MLTGIPSASVSTMFRFSVKWRGSVPLLVSVPPLRGGDFQGIRVYRSDAFWGRARKVNFRARHRLDEPAKLSLGLGRGRDEHRCPPPAQIRTSGITAYYVARHIICIM